MPWGFLRSQGQLEQVVVGGKVGHGVQHQHLVNSVFRHVLFQGGVVIAQVEQVDLLELLRQEGGQGVGVGVPDHQQLPVCRVRVFDDAQGLVAPQEVGILVLDFQLLRVVQPTLNGLALGIAGDGDAPFGAPLGDHGVDAVRPHPARPGGGVGGAVKAVADLRVGQALIAQNFQVSRLLNQAHAL